MRYLPRISRSCRMFGRGELFKTVIIFGGDYACTPDQGVTAASMSGNDGTGQFPTFHLPCIKEISSDAEAEGARTHRHTHTHTRTHAHTYTRTHAHTHTMQKHTMWLLHLLLCVHLVCERLGYSPVRVSH